jgi:hypothetical protein
MTDEELLKEALERFDQSEAAYSEWRREAAVDLEFVTDRQWSETARSTRELSGRPCYTADRLTPAVRMIVNENRQNRPSIKVSPKSGGDEDTAHVITGLIRDIESVSNADTAYDVASEYSVKCGLGYFRLGTEYESDDTFDQSLRITAVNDPLTVYPDPSHAETDGSDMEYCFVVKDLAEETYRRLYGSTKLAALPSWKGSESPGPWAGPGSVRVAEYFYREHEEKALYHVARFRLNSIGELQYDEEAVTDVKPTDEEIESKAVLLLNTRTVDVVKVKCCVLNGKEVISKTEFPGSHIPVFMVKGEETFVRGKRVTMGAIRRARDAQRIVNFCLSSQMEALDLSTKAPWIGAAGQFDGYEKEWQQSNSRSYAYLEYNQRDADGKDAPPPFRGTADVPIGAINTTRLAADADIDKITGIFDAARGERSNETSGVAIIARKQQSNVSTLNYYDNLVRAIRHLGRVIVAALPTFYDTQRVVRVLKPTGEQEMVAINSYLEDGKKHDFSCGEYGVLVKTGASYSTKREQLVEDGMGIIAAYPAAAPLIADLLVSASDFEGARDLAARLKTQVPPEVLAATGEDGSVKGDPKQALAAAQGQLAKQGKDLEAVNAHAAELEEQIAQLQQEMKMLALKRDVELHKIDVEYTLKAQELAINESEIELSFLSGQQKNELARRQLDLQEKSMQIQAVGVAAKVADSVQSAEEKYLERSRDKTIATISDVKPLPFDVSGIIADKDPTNNLDQP